MTGYQSIAWECRDGVGRITLKRPPLNVLDIAMLRELAEALAAAEADLRALVVRAEGRLFSAGVDVADHTPERVGEMIPLFNSVCRILAEFPAPTLAAVHGHALGGGCELALCCDLIVAADSAQFGQPEIKLAAIAPIAALSLPGLIGYRRAAEMLLLGEALGAGEAARLGLINRAVPADGFAAAIDDYVERLRALSAPALRLCKRAARLGAGAWANLPAVEQLYLDKMMAVADAHEGVRAFVEKRAPVWSHR